MIGTPGLSEYGKVEAMLRESPACRACESEVAVWLDAARVLHVTVFHDHDCPWLVARERGQA
jgi:hypothetical protein